MTFAQELHEAKRAILLRHLEAHEWNVLQTAKALKLNRTHLFTLIKRHGIQLPAGRRTGKHGYGNRGNAAWQALQ